MEYVILFSSLSALFFLFVALLELPHVNKLNNQKQKSFEILPLNTSLNDIAPDIGYVFPDVIPLIQTPIHLGRRAQRVTVSVPNCPECGKYLRAINGKYGRFWGCTGYPNCHYTRKYI